MAKCEGQPVHKRTKKHASNHKHSIKGHEWKVDKGERICQKCGTTVPASPYTKNDRRRAAMPFNAPIPYTTEHPWNMEG